MRRRLTVSVFLALCVTLLSAAAVVANVVISDLSGRALGEAIALNAVFMIFGVIGLIILWRSALQRMGWLFIAVAFLWTSGDYVLQLAENLYASADPGPVAPFTAWYLEWYWMPLLFGQLFVLPMLFPTGRPLSPRWNRVFKIVMGVLVFVVVAAALDPKLDVDGRVVGDNALGISPFGDVEDGALTAIYFPFQIISALIGVAALITRFRRSRGEERQQMKWVVFCGASFVFGFFTIIVLDSGFGYRPPFLDAVVLGLLPAGLGTAILKYRLYDIDLFVNRALVYGALTTLLVGFYLASVVGLQVVLEPLTRESDLAIAASTLAAAALFRPLRSRVQGFIDRRFYRRKYDAARTLDTMSLRIRDQVTVDAVQEDVLALVQETVQPAHVSLWLKGDGHAWGGRT